MDPRAGPDRLGRHTATTHGSSAAPYSLTTSPGTSFFTENEAPVLVADLIVDALEPNRHA